MAKASWNNETIAESADTQQVEGNFYFPPASVRREFLKPSDHTTVCGWKGVARYFDVVVDGKTNANAAWYYPDPKPQAVGIKNFVAFWKGVQVQG